MIVIACGGLARAGKTTACEVLAKVGFEAGLRPRFVSFAYGLKRALKRAGITKEKNPEQYRLIAQKWGASRRDPLYRPKVTGEDYWAIITHRLLLEYEEEDTERRAKGGGELLVLIDDVRYVNEINVVNRFKAASVFVDAAKRLAENLAEPWMQHESERMAMDYTAGILPDTLFDFMLTNNGGLSRFRLALTSQFQGFIDNAQSNRTD